MLDPEIAKILGESRRRLTARGAVELENAEPGDLLFSGLRLVRKRIRTKKEAQQVASAFPGGRWMIDGPRTWMVVRPDVIEDTIR